MEFVVLEKDYIRYMRETQPIISDLYSDVKLNSSDYQFYGIIENFENNEYRYFIPIVVNEERHLFKNCSSDEIKDLGDGSAFLLFSRMLPVVDYVYEPVKK